VRLGNNGVINVYAREVTQQWTTAEKSKMRAYQTQRIQQQRVVSLY